MSSMVESSVVPAILFDFDGTIADTETPAMEVAFWEIAPYLKEFDLSKVDETRDEFMRENAGKAFEMMVEAEDEKRKEAGLPTCEEARAAKNEDPAVMAIVNENRKRFGLKAIDELRANNEELDSFFIQQKEETVVALSITAKPNDGMVATLESLKTNRIPYCIATTSPKPRVPACVTTCDLGGHFPPEAIHSGESDFVPPRFKPDPAVYLKAARFIQQVPPYCVAVEDSGSGVGSAANAGLGFIVGYIGANHIKPDRKVTHAKMLMSGSRSKNGRGADIVISDMLDLVPLVEWFRSHVNSAAVPPVAFDNTSPDFTVAVGTGLGWENVVVPVEVAKGLAGRVFINGEEMEK